MSKPSIQGEQRDLNPRIAESQSAALPLGYAHHRYNRLSFSEIVLLLSPTITLFVIFTAMCQEPDLNW